MLRKNSTGGLDSWGDCGKVVDILCFFSSLRGASKLFDNYAQCLRTLGKLLERRPVFPAYRNCLQIVEYHLVLEPAKELGRWDVEECFGPDAGLTAVYGAEGGGCGLFVGLHDQVG